MRLAYPAARCSPHCSPRRRRRRDRRAIVEPLAARRAGAARRRGGCATAHARRPQCGARPRWAWRRCAGATRSPPTRRAYAAQLARTGRFEHSPQPRGTPPQGENLWTGTRGAYSYREMVGHWVAERRFYRPLPVPGVEQQRPLRRCRPLHPDRLARDAGGRLRRGRQSPADDYLVCRYLPGRQCRPAQDPL